MKSAILPLEMPIILSHIPLSLQIAASFHILLFRDNLGYNSRFLSFPSLYLHAIMYNYLSFHSPSESRNRLSILSHSHSSLQWVRMCTHTQIRFQQHSTFYFQMLRKDRQTTEWEKLFAK